MTSTPPHTLTKLTLFPQDFHASHSALPGSEAARMMTATSGRRLYKQLQPLGLPCLLAKTLLESSTWHSTRCLLIWKKRATPARRILYQLAVKVPGTAEIGFGLLLTPTASDGIMSKKKTDNLYITETGTVRLRNKA